MLSSFVYIKWLTLLRESGKNGVEVIVFNGIKWMNEKNIEEELGHANLAAITSRHPLKYKQHRSELLNEPETQPNNIFA